MSKLMKRALAALSLVLALCCTACAAEIDGVWGLKFGTQPEEAYRILSGKDARIVAEYGYMPGYREAIYQVNFFGREGHLLLRFSGKGLFLARFAFVDKAPAPARSENRKPEEPRGPRVIDARSALGGEPGQPVHDVPFDHSVNFIQLKSQLTGKYGVADETFKEGTEIKDGKPVEAVRGCRWHDGSVRRQSITLYDSRSFTKNDTVLTYEDSSRK